jgi:DNA-3-methyladenine glycosylase II
LPYTEVMMNHHSVNLKEIERFDLTIPEPFDFRLTVAKPAGWHWSTPGEVLEGDILWSGVYVGDKPVGIKMSAEGRVVSVSVYARPGLSAGEVETLQDCLRSGLGADEDLIGFYSFARDDPVLSMTVKDLYGMRAGRLDDVFGRVILAILLQMAPIRRSRQMMSALLEYYGTVITFDNKPVTLWPTAGDIARLDPEGLRARANLGYRAKRLVQAARYLCDHPISLRDINALDEDDALKRLEQIPGIGEYSAGMIAERTAMPLDSWSVVIMSELVLKRTPSEPRREIGEVTTNLKQHWGRWGWLAFVYILNDLDKLARTFRLPSLA